MIGVEGPSFFGVVYHPVPVDVKYQKASFDPSSLFLLTATPIFGDGIQQVGPVDTDAFLN